MLNKKNEFIQETTHTCSTSAEDLLARDTINSINTKVENTNEHFTRIFTEETCKHQFSVLSKMSSYESLRDIATKKRNKRDSYTFTVDHDIPLRLQLTMNNKKFLYKDVKLENERIVVFYSEEFTHYIKNIKHWILDGTFKSSPLEFYQIINLQGFIF